MKLKIEFLLIVLSIGFGDILANNRNNIWGLMNGGSAIRWFRNQNNNGFKPFQTILSN